MIVGAMGSWKGREHFLQSNLKSLIDQVDVFHLCLNEYKSIPDFIVPLIGEKLKVIVDPYNTYTSASKFMWINSYDDVYYICFDDDLIYPDNYVKKIVEKIDEYNKEYIITVHSCKLIQNFEKWPRDILAIHYGGDLAKDVPSQIPGTATVAMYVKDRNIDMDFFRGFPMTDLRLAHYICNVWKTKAISIQRKYGWIKSQSDMLKVPHAWKQMRNDVKKQEIATKFCKEYLL